MNTFETNQMRLIIMSMIYLMLASNFAKASATPLAPFEVTVNAVDLELSASSSAPTIFQSGLAEFTIANHGIQAATNVEVVFHTNGTVNISNNPIMSGGVIFDYWTSSPKWVVGTLSPGQNETIKFPIFALSNEINLYGQVTSQNEIDEDSTPDNGDNLIPVEDDEASFPDLMSSNGACEIEVDVLSVICNEDLNDFFDFELGIETQGLSGEGNLQYFINGVFCCESDANTTMYFDNYSINDGPVQMLVKSEDDADDCEVQIMINPPSDCNLGAFPNLVIENFGSTDLIELEPGASNIQLTDIQLVNIGAAACPQDVGYISKIFLSDNEVVSVDDQELAFFIAFGTGINETVSIPSFAIPGNTATGNKFLLIMTDVFQSIEEQDEDDNLFVLPVQVMEENPIVDLELSASGLVPSIFQGGEATFTLTNNSNTAASGIEVGFNKNESIGITNSPEVSQGFAQFHWTTTPKWVVGSLKPGESATIVYPIFTFSNDISFYGQVTHLDQADSDSSPSNGNGVSPIEDDEAVFSNAIGAICSIDATLIGVSCSTEAGFYDAEIVVNGVLPSGSSSIEYFINDISGGFVQLNELSTIQNIPLGLVEFKVLESTPDNACETAIVINPPTDCGEITSCNISLNAAGVVIDDCNSNNTENEEDDTFSFSFTPIVNGNAGSYFINRPILNGMGNVVYLPTTNPSGLPLFLNFNIDDAEEAFGDEIQIEVFDAADMTCSFMVTVEIPETCSEDEAEVADLELSVETDVSFIYQNGSAFFTVTNNGSAVATGVYIEFSQHSSFNITNVPIETQGNANGYWLDTPFWDVGTLEPGQSEMVEFPIFALSSDLHFYAQVTEQDQPDLDSTPDNGDGVTPMEDDEALASMLVFGSRDSEAIEEVEHWNGREMFIQKLYPNPVYNGQINIIVHSKVSQVRPFDIHDNTGRKIKTIDVQVVEGINDVRLNINSLRSGSYIVNIPGMNMKHMVTHFIVQEF